MVPRRILMDNPLISARAACQMRLQTSTYTHTDTLTLQREAFGSARRPGRGRAGSGWSAPRGYPCKTGLLALPGRRIVQEPGLA